MPPSITSAAFNAGIINPGASGLQSGNNQYKLGGDFSDHAELDVYKVSFHGPPNGVIDPASVKIDKLKSTAAWLVGTFKFTPGGPPAPPGGGGGGPGLSSTLNYMAAGDFTVTVKDPTSGLSATFDCQDIGGVNPSSRPKGPVQ